MEEEEEEEDAVVDEETLLMASLGLPVQFASSSKQRRAVRLFYVFMRMLLGIMFI